jgi:hypothetical protein
VRKALRNLPKNVNEQALALIEEAAANNPSITGDALED